MDEKIKKTFENVEELVNGISKEHLYQGAVLYAIEKIKHIDDVKEAKKKFIENVTIDDFEKRLDFYLEKLDKVLDLLDKHDVKS